MTAQPGLCRTWSETPKTGFLTTRLIFNHLSVAKDSKIYELDSKRKRNIPDANQKIFGRGSTGLEDNFFF